MQVTAAKRLGLSAIGLALMAGSAVAAPNLVSNGGFEAVVLTGSNTPYTTANQMDQNNAAGQSTTVTGWATNGYNFIFTPGSADTTGSYTPQFNGNLQLWGPNNGSNNGLPATSPAGGNFVGADPAFEAGAITQSINNLVVGTDYSLAFYYAGAQQTPFTGITTEGWQVNFGAQVYNTATLTNANEGFTGWKQAFTTFRATSSTQVLSFLATGGPSGGTPPFSLLDGVSLVATPEPTTWALLTVGLIGVGLLARRRSTFAAPATA